MLKKYLIIPAVTLLFIISSIGFATAKPQQQEEPVYVANFTYAPASQATPNSTGVTIATIGIPTYISSSKEFWFKARQFDNLQDALKEDLPKLFTAKGFSVKGLYDSYEMIPYPDKKKIDLYLVPTLELFITSRGPSVDCPKGVFGIVKTKGKITLELREVTTKELMWSKGIEFEELKIPVDSLSWAPGIKMDQVNDGTEKAVSVEAVAVTNEVVKSMEKQYPGIMAGFFSLIDPEEMREIKKDCQELRNKKVN